MAPGLNLMRIGILFIHKEERLQLQHKKALMQKGYGSNCQEVTYVTEVVKLHKISKIDKIHSILTSQDFHSVIG